MVRLLVLIFFVNIALLAIALIDCLSTDREEIRTLPKTAWVLIILLLPAVGPGVWFASGRPAPSLTPLDDPLRGNDPARTKPRPIAPDDDPEFLRSLSAATRQADEARLRAWEDDLHRREEELRRNQTDSPPDDASSSPEEPSR